MPCKVNQKVVTNLLCELVYISDIILYSLKSVSLS